MPTGITPLLKWSRYNARIELPYLREIMAEFFGTFLLCLIAVGGTMQSAYPSGNGSISCYPNIALYAHALSYFIAILLFGGVSDGHFNPAVSIGMAIAGNVSWIKLHAFIIVQALGGYLGSLFAYGMYKDLLTKFVGGASIPDAPGSRCIWLANPGSIAIGSGFFNEIVVSMIFMMGFMAVKDMWNTRAPRYIQSLLIGLLILGLSFAFQSTTGVMLNTVRDFAPRLAAITLSWKSETVMKNSSNEQWWAVGFFGPLIGAMVGSFLYIFLIGAQIKEDDNETIGELVAYGNSAGGDPETGNNNQWRATVFIPKPQATRRTPVPPPMQGMQSPYRGVQFQD